MGIYHDLACEMAQNLNLLHRSACKVLGRWVGSIAMGILSATAMQRFLSAIFVLVAMFVACGAVQANPCVMHDDVVVMEHVSHDMDGVFASDDDTSGQVPSIEDNSYSLDDTFDVPPEYVMSVPRAITPRPVDLVPPPHAHHPRQDHRPPIV